METLHSIVEKRKQLAKVFVDVTCTYDVDAHIINGIIPHDYDNNVRGNTSWIYISILKVDLLFHY